MSDRPGLFGRLSGFIRGGRPRPRQPVDPTWAGPFDVADAPEDGRSRLDFGSIRLPVTDGTQVRIEVEQGTSTIRAVHTVTDHGQFTVTAYAVDRFGSRWDDVFDDLVEELRGQGAEVRSELGDLGLELVAVRGDDVVLRFLGVDGPGWLLRGMAAGPPGADHHNALALQELMRATIVVRGAHDLPDRAPLPLEYPAELRAAHRESARHDDQ